MFLHCYLYALCNSFFRYLILMILYFPYSSLVVSLVLSNYICCYKQIILLEMNTCEVCMYTAIYHTLKTELILFKRHQSRDWAKGTKTLSNPTIQSIVMLLSFMSCIKKLLCWFFHSHFTDHATSIQWRRQWIWSISA